MSAAPPPAATGDADIALVVRRTIAASAELLFAAWTEPTRLRAWWGPQGVTCPEARVDLRAGGRYALANRFVDGRTLWISGEFLEVDPPRKLVYTWSVDDPDAPAERTRVTVRFEPRREGTEVIVVHERFADETSRDHHLLGWQGCLERLEALCAPSAQN